jgi:hypothetical protein
MYKNRQLLRFNAISVNTKKEKRPDCEIVNLLEFNQYGFKRVFVLVDCLPAD